MGEKLEKRFAARQKTSESKLKSVVDLALDKYLEDKLQSKDAQIMDATFKKFAISQMKVFILAGHDTTSATLCYLFYLLAKHPRVLQQARAEHDEVFGSDITQARTNIIADPYLLNQLPFTVAVIKETIRLFPAASSARDGEQGFSITEDGHQYPTEGCMVWSLHQAIHHEPLYWPEPEAFIPERWLVSKDHPLYPVKGAWRPFEFGPRNCIGQELVMLEIKLVMAMIIREFNVEACYDEWDRVKGKKGLRIVNGERAYQVINGTTRPAEGFPCRISIAKR